MAACRKFTSILGSSVTAVAALAVAQPAMAQDGATAIDTAIDASAGPTQALAFARSQVGQGDLLGAAATLERALFDGAAQGTGDVRAYYIAVLCKLDDRERAVVEAGKFGNTYVSDAAWAETEQACGSLPRPTANQARQSSIVGKLSAGFAFDSDNRGAVNQFFTFPGFSTPADDGFSFVADLNVDAKFPTGNGYVYAGLDALTKDSFTGPGLNYQIVTGRAGYGMSLGSADLSFGPVATYIRLQDRDFAGEVGGQMRLTLPAPANGQFVTAGEVVYQNYVGSFPLFSRDGTRFDLAFDYQKQASNGVSYVLGIGGEYKTAETAELGYSAGRIFGAVRYPLGNKGVYAAWSGTIRHIVYRFSPGLGAKQIETRYFLRAALGVPLKIKGVAVEAAGSYTRRDYNIAFLQDYSSVGAELRLVWRFGK